MAKLVRTRLTEPLREAKYLAVEVGVNDLVRVVEALPKAARRCWDQATRRTFDIGIDGPARPGRGTGIPLSQRTLEGVARVGGRIVITVYPPEPD